VFPNAIDMAPYMIDFIPDEHTLFKVVQGVYTESPASRETCLAGA